MAESTLSTSFDDIKQAVGHYRGIGTDDTKWSASDISTIDMIIKRGLRQFYWPPSGTQWSFLKPVCTLDTVAPYDTGTIAVALAGTTVTLTTGVWPSWTATHGTLVVDNTEYAIATRTDDTHLELSAAWTEATETAATFVLNHDGNYDLPDDYGNIEGDIVNETSTQYPDLTIVGEGRIRSERRVCDTRSYPIVAAVRPKEHTVTTAGQRFEILFYPIPDAVYTLSYVKKILPQMLVDTTLTYPYGGAMHAETILASCLAIAEEMDDDRSKTTLKDKYNERLKASIILDSQSSPDYYGKNDNHRSSYCRDRHYRDGQTCRITYQGIEY